MHRALSAARFINCLEHTYDDGEAMLVKNMP